MTISTLWVALALLGCDNGMGLDTSLNKPGDSCVVHDPVESLAGIEHACEQADLYDPNIATATSYFLGDFTINADDSVEGLETWVLYANPRWIEEGGGDCQIVWDAEGVVGKPVNKGDINIALEYSINTNRTDCPEAIYRGSETFEQDYDIVTRNCESKWFFPDTGTKLGDGGFKDVRVTYASGLDCLLF